MRKFLWFVAGILVGATFKGEFKVTVREVTEDSNRAERGAVQLTQYINSSGLVPPEDVYRHTSQLLRRGLSERPYG